MTDQDTSPSAPGMRLAMRFRLAAFASFFVICLAYTIESSGFYPTARYTPFAAGSVATVLAAILTVRELLRLLHVRRHGMREYSRSLEAGVDTASLSSPQLRASLKYSLYVIVFMLATIYLGLIYAAPAFIGLMLLFDARKSVVFTVLSMAGAVAFVRLAMLGGLRFPRGLWF